jgi:hypothetical protein
LELGLDGATPTLTGPSDLPNLEATLRPWEDDWR